uniref:Poly [ADP-ribose] polymerase n=1 Tax=Alexandrium monilatum TaxID=311494 RepID=A0A7S4T5C9_9DINO
MGPLESPTVWFVFCNSLVQPWPVEGGLAMADFQPGLLRVVAVEAFGLASRASSVRVSIRLDGQLLGRSPAIEAAPSARWSFEVHARLPHQPARLFFEVTRPGILRCTTTSVGGFTLPVDGSTQIDAKTFPLWDSQQRTVGSLLVSIQGRSSNTLQGGLTNMASPPVSSGIAPHEADTAALLESRSSQSHRSFWAVPPSRGETLGGLVNYDAGNAPCPAVQPSLPGALSNRAAAEALGSPAPSVLSRSRTLGLRNQAEADAETGARPNALPRAEELLRGLAAFAPEDPGHCRSLARAVDELRHAPTHHLEAEGGAAALRECGTHIESLLRHALSGGNEEAAGRAIWLAGRLPQSDGDDGDHADESLQDRLRRDFHRHQMELALGRAEKAVPEAKEAKGGLWRLMDSLDLLQSHATLSKIDASPRLGGILSELRPHVVAQLEALLKAGQLEEVEEIVNAIGAGRIEALGLHGVSSRLDALKGIDLLRSALTPAPGQIGFPLLKQRVLRHATMTARTALAGHASADIVGRLDRLLLQELLPLCVRHSCESTLAVLETAFDLLDDAGAVWVAARAPYGELSGERKSELARRLPGACRGWRMGAPAWLLSAEQARCQQMLRSALDRAEPSALQEALVMAKEADGAREVCAAEFEEAIGLLRSQHRLPEGWDVESMLAGQAERMLAKHELTDPRAVRAFDALLKGTTNPVWTRDRRGRVTKAFEAVRVVHVMNAGTWAGYVQRRDEILDECSRGGCRSDDSFWQGGLNGVPLTRGPFEALSSLLAVPPLVERANEVWLLHGTSHSGAAAISSDDFDMARARPTGLYGAGIYLAESVSKSANDAAQQTIDACSMTARA